MDDIIYEKVPQRITWVLSSGMVLDTMASAASYLMYAAAFMEYNYVQNKQFSNLAQISDSVCENRLKLYWNTLIFS